MQKAVLCLVVFVLISTKITLGEDSFDRPSHKIFIVSPEYRLMYSGGLGNVTTDTSYYLKEYGHNVTLIMPYYSSIHKKLKNNQLIDDIAEIDVKADEFAGTVYDPHKFIVKEAIDQKNGIRILFFKQVPQTRPDGRKQVNYFDNPGGISYSRHDWETQGRAFGLLDKAIFQYINDLQDVDRPDILILNDWTTGVLAILVRRAIENENDDQIKWPKMIGAIHNIKFHGDFNIGIFKYLGIEEKYLYREKNNGDGAAHHGRVNFLKSLMIYSDLTYTVSRNYADEITTPSFGNGMDPIARKLKQEHRLTAILNGLDEEKWDPKRPVEDKYAKGTFDIQDIKKMMQGSCKETGKEIGKRILQEELGLPVNNDIPLIVATSRLSDQKGADYLLTWKGESGVFERIMEEIENVQIVVNADGFKEGENQLRALSKQYPRKFKYGNHNIRMEKLLTIYGDAFLNASEFEPCGVNQMYCMRNGNIPLVSKLGGLSETVTHNKTGFLFDITNKNKKQRIANIMETISNFIYLYENNPKKVLKMRVAGMMEENSWEHRMETFENLFEYVMHDGPKKLRWIGVPYHVPTPKQLNDLVKNLPSESIEYALKYIEGTLF